MTLAFVEEKSPTNKISEIGLIDHHGSAPAPPGFEINAKFGPPPAIANPGSSRRFFGLDNVEKDQGVLTSTGAITKARRRHNLSWKNRIFPYLRKSIIVTTRVAMKTKRKTCIENIQEIERINDKRKILRQEVTSIVSQSRINNPIYGKRISVTTVPIRPEFMLAIATGEIA